MKNSFKIALSVFVILLLVVSGSVYSQEDVQPEPKIRMKYVEESPIWKVTVGIIYEVYGIRYFSKQNDIPFELKNNLLPSISMYSDEGVLTLSYGLGSNEVRLFVTAPIFKHVMVYATGSFVPYTNIKKFGCGLQKNVAYLNSSEINLFTEVGLDSEEKFLSIGIRLNFQDKLWRRK